MGTNNVDQLVNWGSNQATGYCDWNEHFHPDINMQFLIFFSSHGYAAEGSSWAGCSASQPTTSPPLDAWQTRLVQFTDSAGNLHITSEEIQQGNVGATRLTFLNVAGTPDSIFFCAQVNPLTAPVDCSLGAWGGGDGQYGPNGVYFAILNAPGFGAVSPNAGNAIMTVSRNSVSTRLEGQFKISGKLSIIH